MRYHVWITCFVVMSFTGHVISMARDRDVDSQWGRYKLDYNKTYVDDFEEVYRRHVWYKKARMILEHNEMADKGQRSFWVAMNEFGDMTTDEVNFRMNGMTVDVDYDETNITDDVDSNFFPKNVDWRTRGYVTHVKYQGHCGSCYAFSATGSLEGQHFRKTGRLVSLSEQNILDCTYMNTFKNKGCRGGTMDKAFKYIIQNGGVDTEKSYPYEMEVDACRFEKQDVGATAATFHDILPRGSELQLQNAAATEGPISVGIDAHSMYFHHYHRGIYNNRGCSSRKLNHGVLVVGYGVNRRGKEYWIVKNSWGQWWGKDGYVKMTRNKNNQCGIATLASYPIV